MIQFFKEVHANGKLVKGINSSFVALINDSPVILAEYQPISLIGSIYKLRAKVLLNRLKQVLSGIISNVQ